jgi:hypothetical protein
MWSWLRHYLNFRQIALLGIAIFVAPFWILNWENLIQQVGLDRVLLDSEGRPIMIQIIEFLQLDPVKWSIIGGLVVAFLPPLGRIVLNLCDRAQAIGLTFLQYWRDPVYNRKRRIAIGQDALALSRDIMAFILDHRPWPSGIRFYDLSGITTGGRPPPDTLEKWWAEIQASRLRHDTLTRELQATFSRRLGRVELELRRLGYLEEWDAYSIDPLMLEAVAQHMGALAYRLLEDNGFDLKSISPERFSPSDTQPPPYIAP